MFGKMQLLLLPAVFLGLPNATSQTLRKETERTVYGPRPIQWGALVPEALPRRAQQAQANSARRLTGGEATGETLGRPVAVAVGWLVEEVGC